MKASRSFLKIATSYALILMSLVLISCGSDNKNAVPISNNPVQDPFFGNGGSGGFAPFNPQYGVSCSASAQGQTILLSKQGLISYNGSSTQGGFVQGHIAGVSSDRYYGVNSLGDSLIVDKIVGGNQVIGINVTLSLCDSPQFPLALSQRSITFQDGALVLNESLNHVEGNVDFGHFKLILGAYNVASQQGNFTMPAVPVDFWFRGAFDQATNPSYYGSQIYPSQFNGFNQPSF
ncbi:hypothetical protein N9O57_01665 [bacterium]|nr:hypothetical protein [bacterium]